MKSQSDWIETKFKLTTDGKLHVNKKFSILNSNSWIVTECVARAYAKYIPIYMQGDLLDLGCGNCPFYGFYKQFISSVFCIDWANSLHANPYNDISCDISKPLPLEDSIFDTILLSDVLEHIFEPECILNESYRLLKSNGVLFLNVPFLYWIHENPYDFYRYTEFALKQLASKSGFTIEIIEIVGGSLETWADITSKLTSYLPIARIFFPRLLFELVFFLRKFNSLNHKLAVIDSLFPTGYFIVMRKSI
jgi:SAM-dependent methyltransferase